MENLRPLSAELRAVWSDISNSTRGFKNQSLHKLVLDEVLSLELSKFSRQLKLKPGIDAEHRVIVAMSNDLWFRGMEIKEGGDRRKNYKETRAVKGKEGFDRIDSMLEGLGAGWTALFLVALLSEGNYDVIISAPNRGVEMENLRPLSAELPTVWSDISKAMRGFKSHSLHILVLVEVLALELSKFSRQLKLKPGIDDDHQEIVARSNDLWFRGMEIKEGGDRRKNSKETRAHLEATVSRTKPEANKWLHLTHRIAHWKLMLSHEAQ